MDWNFFITKGTAAPYIFILLQALFLTGTYYTSMRFNHLLHSTLGLLFIIDVILTLVFYFVVYFSDPGYIGAKGVFFTDQEEPQLEKGEGKQPAADILKGVSDKLPPVDQKKTSNSIMKKLPLMGASDGPTQKLGFEKMIEEDDIHNKSTEKEDEDGVEEKQHVEIQMEEKNQSTSGGNFKSIYLDEQLSQNPTHRIDVNSARNDAADIRPGLIQKKEEEVPKGVQIRKKIIAHLTTDVDQGKVQRRTRSVFIRHDSGKVALHTDQDVPSRGFEIENKNLARKVDRFSLRAKSGNYHQLNKEAESPRFIENLDQPELQDENDKSASNITRTDTSGMEAPPTERPNEIATNFVNEVRAAESKVAEGVLKVPVKNPDMPKEKVEVIAAKQFYDEIISKAKKSNDSVELDLSERLYCTVCALDQPIRARHCKYCGRCVASFDHHCPWIGNCIGEKNHLFFLWYIFFQFIESIVTETELIRGFFDDTSYTRNERIVQSILGLGLSFFTIMVTCLLFYHIYLVAQNLTTMEHLRWTKIFYLKNLSPKHGSPFSKGFWGNVSYFCCDSYKGLRKWRFSQKYKEKKLAILGSSQ